MSALIFRDDSRIPGATPPARELMVLRRSLGGAIGELTVAGEKLGPVLKVDATNYVLPVRPPHAAKTIAAMAGADLHGAPDHASGIFLRQLYRRTYGSP